MYDKMCVWLWIVIPCATTAANYDSNDDSDYHPFGNDVECKSDNENDQSCSNSGGDNDNTSKNKDTSAHVCDDEITSGDNDSNCCSSDGSDSDEPHRKRRRINSGEKQKEKASETQIQSNDHSSHNGAPDKSQNIENSSHHVETCFNEEYCQYLEKSGLSASPKRLCYEKYVSQVWFSNFN